MIENPVVFIAEDYILKDNLDEISEKLRENGVKVVRGPMPIPGVKLVFQPQDYEKYFSEANVMMFSSRSVCDEGVIDAGKRLIGIVNPTCGMDTVDTEYATKNNIILGNGPVPGNINSVAEATIMMMFLLLQRPDLSLKVTNGELEKPPMKEIWHQALWKKKVGILGFGNIGKAIASRLVPFEVEILASSPHLTTQNAPEYVTACSQETLFRECDIVCICVVINESTKDIVNRHTLSLMKKTAFLINTSRGGAVDEDALYEALRDKKIAGAALDNTKIEPLPMDSKLRTLDNIFLLPHMAGYSIENYKGITETAVHNIMNILNEEKPVYCKNAQIESQWRERISRVKGM